MEFKIKLESFNPLVLLRLILPFFFAKYLIAQLDFLYSFANRSGYELSNTWINSFMPTRFITFNDFDYLTYKYLILAFTITAVIGFMGRISLFILSMLCFIIVGSVEGLGAFDHHMSLSGQIIFALSVLPSSMNFSFDRLILNNMRAKKNRFILRGNVKWEVNLLLLMLALTYFTAGLSKLRYSEGKWLDGSTLGFYLEERTMDYPVGKQQLLFGDVNRQTDFSKDNYGFYSHTYGNYQNSRLLNNLIAWLSEHRYFLIFMSIATVLLELSGFVVFINERFRNVYLLSAILMHLSIGFLMGLGFVNYRVICLCLMEWKSLIKLHKDNFTFLQTK
ncbi:MAG: HTTM domain-containing protein [Bacteroidota bacterium]